MGLSLIPLCEYDTPSIPTDHAIRKAYATLRGKLLQQDKGPMLTGERLRPATLKLMNQVVDPPASGPYLVELSAALQEWLLSTPSQSLGVVILPPCDTDDIIARWAEAGGHQLLAPPVREQLMNGGAVPALDLDGPGLLVIPRLEYWFLRQRNGLAPVRALLARLALLERRCLIGCNSWAWSFLVKAAGADVLLPAPLAFPAFDAQRLHRWFSDLAADKESRQITFRAARGGDDVLAVDAEDKPTHRYMQVMAARSLGIPWVAWHLWRTSLRARTDAGDISDPALKATASDVKTLWVVDIDDYRLPPRHQDRALLVLQALLIHHALTPLELKCVLPETGEPDMIPALLAAGFVERRGERLSVGAAAYPSVREALIADGCPVGEM